MQLLERETRREKTLEQRSKDGKGKQGPKTSIFHLAIASVGTPSASQNSLGIQQRQSHTSPTKKMFESVKETLQALHSKENTCNNETNKEETEIELSADMLPVADNHGQISVCLTKDSSAVPTVDQTLQSSEEAYFEAIYQV